MIYFDNSATTITKPKEVAEAVAFAVNNFGNAGRSFYDAALLVSREIFKTRVEIAKLIGLSDPLRVAFTSSSTESLNLVAGGLVGKDCSVITTVTEHNSVLRPLYLTGCELGFIDCDDNGNLLLDSLEDLIKPSTKCLFCTHGSNVTGNITDVAKAHSICKSKNIIMVLDISQTFGTVPVHMDMADVFCFTGHKGLFGPQGTGGVIVSGGVDIDIVKTGGAGVNSFDMLQPKEMPDIFETGTPNGHGLYGLQKGVSFVNTVGIEEIHAKEMRLVQLFYDGIKDIGRIRIYGDFASESRLPVISITLDGMASSDLAEQLWATYGIATRAGSHCAPLLHKRFDTVDKGMVRFSFSFFNTENEINQGIAAIKNIIQSSK